MDAPLGFTLDVYNDQTGKWETVSTVACWPDLKNNILFVDHLAGPSDKSSARITQRAASCFVHSIAPPLAAFVILAKQQGIRKLGIRNAKDNKWAKVRNRSEEKKTAYDVAIDHYNDFVFTNEPYIDARFPAYTMIDTPNN